MPFKKVSKSGRGGTTEPMISIRKSGSIGINNAALQEFFTEDEEYAEIFYDEENERLGIHALEEDTDDSYTLSRTESGGAVAPTSFLKGNRLIPDVTTQYSPYKQSVNDDTVLVAIDLDDPIGTYGEPDSEDDAESTDTE